MFVCIEAQMEPIPKKITQHLPDIKFTYIVLLATNYNAPSIFIYR